MATINLSSDAYYVNGTPNVNEKFAFVIPTGTVANTYVLPGTVVGQVPGGPAPGSRFTVINQSANTMTFSAPAGFTLTGTTSLATGATTPTRVTFYYLGGNAYAGF